MLGIVLTIIPVFVLIALGYGAAKGRLISTEGGRGIDAYVYWFAIPALLFITMLDMELGQAAPWRLWGTYYLGVLAVWVAAGLIAIPLRGEAAAGGSAMGMGSSFGNILMMGLPVALLRFGEGAVEHAALIIAIHAPVQWVCCSVWAEAAQHKGGVRFGKLLGQVALSLAKNPMIIALAAGIAFNLLDVPAPGLVMQIVNLLSESAPAAALFALGMALALYSVRGNVRVLGVIMALKLMFFPAVMWVLATRVFSLPPDEAHVVILFAALPVGVNAYLFASRYNANIGAVSSAIMLSVPASALTLPVVLYLMGG
jgi:hypothetical protein